LSSVPVVSMSSSKSFTVDCVVSVIAELSWLGGRLC
jgi:hypothetical protein